MTKKVIINMVVIAVLFFAKGFWLGTSNILDHEPPDPYSQADAEATGSRDDETVIPELKLIGAKTTNGAISFDKYRGYSLYYLIMTLRKMDNECVDAFLRDAAQHDLNERLFVNDPTLVKLDLKPGDVIADIGCGTGFFLETFYDKAGPEGKVYATDTDPNSIRFIQWLRDTRQILEDTHYDFVPVVSRFDDVCIPEETLDWAFLRDVHNYTYTSSKDKSRYIKDFTVSLANSLKPDGKVMIIETWLTQPQQVPADIASTEEIIKRVESFSENKLKHVETEKIEDKLVIIFEKV